MYFKNPSRLAQAGNVPRALLVLAGALSKGDLLELVWILVSWRESTTSGANEALLRLVQERRRLSGRRPLAERTLVLIRGALPGDATESIS